MPVVAADVRRRTHWAVADFRLPTNEGQSGRGQPHSKTLSRGIARRSFREVLECGCPLPLSLRSSAGTVSFVRVLPLSIPELPYSIPRRLRNHSDWTPFTTHTQFCPPN